MKSKSMSKGMSKGNGMGKNKGNCKGNRGLRTACLALALFLLAPILGAEPALGAPAPAAGPTVQASEEFHKDAPEQSIEKIRAINRDYIIDNQTQPTFAYDGTNNPAANTSTIFEQVWIEVPCDTDEDGKRDMVRIQIARPKASGELLDPLTGETKVSLGVLMEHSPYRNSISSSYLPNWPVVRDQIANPSTAGYRYLTDVQTKKPRSNNWYWGSDAQYWDYTAKEWTKDSDGGNASWYVTPREGASDAAWFIPQSRGDR